MFPFEMFN